MAMESARSDTARARLAALKIHLDARGVTTRLDTESLAVLDSAGTEQVDTITVRPWPVDRDAWWFFDCTDTAIAESGDVVGAGVAIVGNMHRSGIHV